MTSVSIEKEPLRSSSESTLPGHKVMGRELTDGLLCGGPRLWPRGG